jgi:hypothetical protein
MFGRPLIFLILLVFVTICVFVLAQWAIPLLFSVVDVTVPSKVVNVLAILIAIGILYGGWSRNVVTA